MSRTEHKRKPRAERIARHKDLVGQRVELTRALANGLGTVFPVGTRMTVDQTWRGKFRLIIGFASPRVLFDVPRHAFRPTERTDGTPCFMCRLAFGIPLLMNDPSAGAPCPTCGKAVPA